MTKVQLLKIIKECNEEFQQEITLSKVILLESDGDGKYIMYEDRFGRQWQLYKRGGQFSLHEYIPN